MNGGSSSAHPVTPTSTRAAGEAELAVRRARSDEDQKSLGLNEEELAGLNALANGLQAFRKKYPLGWFAERNSAITSLDEQ